MAARRRSIWRGLMARSCWHTVAESRRRRRAQGSHRGSSAFSRTDQGYPAASQIVVNAWIIASPYVAGRRRRRGRAGPGGGPLRIRSAYLRW